MSKQLSIAIVRTDNSIDVGQHPVDLRSLQGYVGGYIEVVNLGMDDGTVMVCNEEGKLSNEPLLNNIASMMYEICWGFQADYIAGDVIVLGTGKDGEFGDLTEKGFELITNAVEQCRSRARI